MNKERRIEIQKIADRLAEIKDDLQLIHDEEETAYENMPESLQGAAKGEAMQETVEELDSMDGDLESMINNLIEITQK
jgi:hypothetical protein